MIRLNISRFGKDIIFIILLKVVAVFILYKIFFSLHNKPEVSAGIVADRIVYENHEKNNLKQQGVKK